MKSRPKVGPEYILAAVLVPSMVGLFMYALRALPKKPRHVPLSFTNYETQANNQRANERPTIVLTRHGDTWS